MYLPDTALSLSGVRSLLTQIPYDILYLNGVFAKRFSIYPMSLRKLGLIPQRPVVIASRGELSAGALALKSHKKRLFLSIAKLTGLYEQPLVTWQASTADEEADIRRVAIDRLGRSSVRTRIASNLAVGPRSIAEDPAWAVGGSAISPGHHMKKPGHLNLIFVARISPMKNLVGLLAALKSVRGDVRLTVHGPLEDRLYWQLCLKAIQELPAHVEVAYGGPLEHTEVTATIARHQLFALPTFGENFGHVIAEALLAGCPVLTTDATPWAEIQTSGAGTIVSATDTPGIAAALQRYIDMDEPELRRISLAARSLGNRHAANPESISQNRALFTNAAYEPLG
jgi:glycosyltransferase involved in cell wall biosynthesis